MRSPFTPSFGVTPPVLVGCDEQLDTFHEALAAGVGDPGRVMLLTGPRGAGKTVTLNELKDLARSRGGVVSETTQPGVSREIVDSTLPELLRQINPNADTSRVTVGQASAAGFGAGIDRDATSRYHVQLTLRSLVTTGSRSVCDHYRIFGHHSAPRRRRLDARL